MIKVQLMSITNEVENSVTSDEIGINNQSKIGYDIVNKNNINYFQKELSSTDSRKDSYLKTQHS